MPVVSTRNNPFLDRESATAALRNYIHGTVIDRGGMYLLNIINTLIQNEKEIFERIPQEIFRGLPEGGRRNVQAAVICRAENGTVPQEQETVLESGYTKEQELIGNWAERDGCWHDTANSDLEAEGHKHDPTLDGSESMVYFDDKKQYVHKIIDHVRYETLERLLDRIHIHNAVFPECPMVVQGFGMRDYADDNTGFSVIVRQPFVIGDAPTEEQIQEHILKRGLISADNGAGWIFTTESGNVIITDLHDGNAVFTRERHVVVFDCEARLNDIKGLKGTYRIPPLNYSEESVKKICDAINSVTPAKQDRDSVLARLDPTTRKTVTEQLKGTGRFDGTVTTVNGDTLLIQNDPSDPLSLLVSTPDRIRKMMSHGPVCLDDGIALSDTEKETVLSGGGFKRGDTYYAFDLDKGRIAEFRQFQLKLRKTTVQSLSI